MRKIKWDNAFLVRNRNCVLIKEDAFQPLYYDILIGEDLENKNWKFEIYEHSKEKPSKLSLSWNIELLVFCGNNLVGKVRFPDFKNAIKFAENYPDIIETE